MKHYLMKPIYIKSLDELKTIEFNLKLKNLTNTKLKEYLINIFTSKKYIINDLLYLYKLDKNIIKLYNNNNILYSNWYYYVYYYSINTYVEISMHSSTSSWNPP